MIVIDIIARDEFHLVLVCLFIYFNSFLFFLCSVQDGRVWVRKE